MATLKASPALDARRVSSIANSLRQRAAGFWLRTLFKLLIGIPLSLIAPALLACIIYAAMIRIDPKSHPNWLLLWGISSALLVPLFYWLEWRTGGNYLVDEMRWQGTTVDHFYNSSAAGWEGRRDEATGAAYTEIVLWPVRQVMEAISGVRRRVRINSAQLHRAAEIVARLSTMEGSIPTANLRNGDESKDDVLHILRYLQFHEWIDISKTADRAWLLSTARKWVR